MRTLIPIRTADVAGAWPVSPGVCGKRDVSGAGRSAGQKPGAGGRSGACIAEREQYGTEWCRLANFRILRLLMATVNDKLPDSEGLRTWREAVPNDRLAHLLKEAVRGTSRALQIRLMDYPVSLGYWVFLRILWERDGITQRELSILAGVREPTTFSALQAMEKLGYIQRRKVPPNMRNICIYLTSAGRDLKAALVPLAEEVNEIAIQGVPAKDIVILRKTLLRIIDNLERNEQESNRRVPPSRKMT